MVVGRLLELLSGCNIKSMLIIFLVDKEENSKMEDVDFEWIADYNIEGKEGRSCH